MRKRLITPTSESIRSRGEAWLDLERAAVVEVTSEDQDWPVEFAFGPGDARGWRAAVPGSQPLRLVFDQPQRLRCISLVFEENETARTQEFVLRWSSDDGSSVKEIVRQQWNFSPGTSSLAHLRENLQSSLLQIPPEVMADLDAIGTKPVRPTSRRSAAVQPWDSRFRVEKMPFLNDKKQMVLSRRESTSGTDKTQTSERSHRAL